MKINLKRGMVIPVVMLFLLIASVFVFSLTYSRKETRRQGLSNMNQKQAHYMAMAGIQHALLKVRLLHREAYDAGSVKKGICPFFNPYGDNLVATDLSGAKKSEIPMQHFLFDLNSNYLPLDAMNDGGDDYKMLDDPEFKWGYEVKNIEVTTYYTSDTDGSVKEVAMITAEGTAFDPRVSKLGRHERVTKKIELQRIIK